MVAGTGGSRDQTKSRLDKDILVLSRDGSFRVTHEVVVSQPPNRRWQTTTKKSNSQGNAIEHLEHLEGVRSGTWKYYRQNMDSNRTWTKPWIRLLSLLPRGPGAHCRLSEPFVFSPETVQEMELAQQHNEHRPQRWGDMVKSGSGTGHIWPSGWSKSSPADSWWPPGSCCFSNKQRSSSSLLWNTRHLRKFSPKRMQKSHLQLKIGTLWW